MVTPELKSLESVVRPAQTAVAAEVAVTDSEGFEAFLIDEKKYVLSGGKYVRPDERARQMYRFEVELDKSTQMNGSSPIWYFWLFKVTGSKEHQVWSDFGYKF